jgi:hypothetical protein
MNHYERNIMNKAINKIKQAWDENPLAVVAVASTAVFAVAKLMDATTARKNAKAWEIEVNRRAMAARR